MNILTPESQLITEIEKPQLITEIEQLQNFVENFLSSDQLWNYVNIKSSLRKPIRSFKKKYPELIFFAYGLQKEYKFFVSKTIFNVNYFDLSIKSRKIFVSDTGIKIDPKATKEQLTSVYEYLDLNKWFNLLSDVLIFMGSEKDFISKHHEIRKNMVGSIKKSAGYISWKKNLIEKKKLLNDLDCKGNNLYQQSNHNKYFISIDLKEANFQVMKLNNLIDKNSWDDFVAKYVTHPYFGKLKLLRLKILSSNELFPNKQLIYWQNLMIDICNNMMINQIITPENLVVFNSDEIVLKTTNETMLTDKKTYQQFISEKFPELIVNTEIFQLKTLIKNQDLCSTEFLFDKTQTKTAGPYFVKINPENQKVTFKCVNSHQMADAIDLYEKLIISTMIQ